LFVEVSSNERTNSQNAKRRTKNGKPTVKIDIVTIFPRMLSGPLAEGIVGRAIERGLLDVRVHDLRDHTTDRHRVVDDVPFGGGPGMVLKPEPLFAAVEFIRAQRRREADAGDEPTLTTEPEGRSGGGSAVILTSPDGERLTHAVAQRLSALEHIIVLCGRYEGVDERVRTSLATATLSIGDYVLSGGELPALVIVDAVARFVRGVVGDEQSVARDTFARGLLDYPQYTRPAEFRGMSVPPVLLSGHHAEIEKWRRREALRRTLERRPDLLQDAALDADDRAALQEFSATRPARRESE
jgi:tRNA (guanine37-N1)-methyltransferase